MSNLTEKWKNRELVEGIYYYIKVNGKVIPARLSKYGNFYLTEGACGRNAMRKVEEVLAPVPSYEEWQEKQKALKVLAEAYCKEKQENQRLEKLLKKVRCYLLDDYDIEDRILLCETIDEVLK